MKAWSGGGGRPRTAMPISASAASTSLTKAGEEAGPSSAAPISARVTQPRSRPLPINPAIRSTQGPKAPPAICLSTPSQAG